MRPITLYANLKINFKNGNRESYHEKDKTCSVLCNGDVAGRGGGGNTKPTMCD